jgi:methyl-accepting chemotaxis protein
MVGKKIFVSFAIVIALAIILGGTSLGVIYYIDTSYSVAYETNSVPIPYLSGIQNAVLKIRVELRDAALGSTSPETVRGNLNSVEKDMADYIAIFENATKDGAVNADYIEAKKIYEEEFLPRSYGILDALQAGDSQAAANLMAEAGPVNTTLIDKLESSMRFLITEGMQNSVDNSNMSNSLIIITIIIIVIMITAAVVVGVYLSRIINIPIKEMAEAADMVAAGDIDIALTYDSPDEIGDLGRSFRKMVDSIKIQDQILRDIANGDFSGEIKVRSDKDVINKSISSMLDKNNYIMMDIRSASSQVEVGAGEIAQSAQVLASGSSEQAASIEEFSASVSIIHAQAERNSEIANETFNDTENAGRLMETSMNHMNEMIHAMQTISESSQNIAKVIKVIDSIATQTNLLALNASVEAARAGQHGKGFAVVADVVRNLASKSASAAKETAALIDDSAQSVIKGNEIVQQTNESLVEVAKIAASNADNMQKLLVASKKQSESIAEINHNIEQIGIVVQSNSATAEQSAAAAQEMSAQSTMLNQIVSQFKLRDGLKPEVSNAHAPSKNEVVHTGFALNSDDKY